MKDANWAGVLAHDLRLVFKTEYENLPGLPLIDWNYVPPEPFWKKRARDFLAMFNEWRGIVTR